MPLRDHFRSPLHDVRSWDELHGMWPATIVRALIGVVPEPFYAAARIHLGMVLEIDPRKPSDPVDPRLPLQDVYDVRIYDSRRNRRLVAAIEIVSPSNKDRPETRGAFLSKVASLLEHNICVSIVDVVSTRDANLYAELLNFAKATDPALGERPPVTYAATLRIRYDDRRRMMDCWYYPLSIGQPLPTLPIWLNESLPIPLDLESTYEETCRTLRIR